MNGHRLQKTSLRTWRPQTDTHRADGWEGVYSYIVTSVLQDNDSVMSSRLVATVGAQFSQGQLRLCPCLIVYTMVQDAEPNQPLELGEKAAGHWGAETRESKWGDFLGCKEADEKTQG